MMILLLMCMTIWAEPVDGTPIEGLNKECTEESPTTDTDQKTGKSVYQATCQSCHQANGSGTQGVYPPLTNSEFVNGDPQLLAHIILRGLSGEIYVNNERYASYMSAYGKKLSDKEIQELIYYIQTEFGSTKKENIQLMDEKEIETIRTAKQGRIKGMKGIKAINSPDNSQ